MRPATSIALALAVIAASACTGGSSPTTPASNSNPIAPFAGTWTSTTLSSGAPDLPGCIGVTYTVTPTGPSTASIAYSATCGGAAVSGTGTGTVSGSTLNWTTSGSAGTCGFSINGIAAPIGSSDLTISYGGVVCNLPVGGSQTLHK